MNARRFAPLLLALCTVGAPARALSEDSNTGVRRGTTYGVSIGSGVITGCSVAQVGNQCRARNGSVSVDGHVGHMVTERVAVVGELWGIVNDDGNTKLAQGTATVGARAWVLPQVWLQGGAGIAHVQLDFAGDMREEPSKRRTLPGLVAAAGLELVSNRRFAVDLAVRAGAHVEIGNVHVNNLVIGVGFSWY